jgi:hypothetical protein
MEVPEHIVLGDGTNRPRTRRSVAAELTQQQGQPPAAKMMVVPERITLGGGGNATAGFSGAKQQTLDQQAFDVSIMFFMKK